MRGVRIVETVVAAAGLFAAWSLVAIALAQVAILLARKAGVATVAAQEAVMVLAVPAVLLAIPWALQRERHVAVDLFAGPRARTVGALLALLLGLALLWFAAPYAWSSFAAGEGSYEAGGIGWRWLAKAALPVFALLLAAQALVSFLRRP